MATIEEKQTADRTKGAGSGIPVKGDTKAASESDAGARNFIKTHDVTKVRRKDSPGAGEEAADLSQAED
jgi:hypothetical protein